jgi:hypothetical protein
VVATSIGAGSILWFGFVRFFVQRRFRYPRALLWLTGNAKCVQSGFSLRASVAEADIVRLGGTNRPQSRQRLDVWFVNIANVSDADANDNHIEWLPLPGLLIQFFPCSSQLWPNHRARSTTDVGPLRPHQTQDCANHWGLGRRSDRVRPSRCIQE